jgi:hypothetical protein
MTLKLYYKVTVITTAWITEFSVVRRVPLRRLCLSQDLLESKEKGPAVPKVTMNLTRLWK